MRALLVVNPRATSTSARTRDVIAHALSYSIDLDVADTTHRTHGERGFEYTEATVKIELNGEAFYTVDEGDGPVNALDAALRKALAPFHPGIAAIRLEDYKVRIINGPSRKV